MKNKLAFLFQDWHPGRWIRLVLGAGIMVAAIVERDWLLALLAGLFLLQALTNSACCGSGNCGTDRCSR